MSGRQRRIGTAITGLIASLALAAPSVASAGLVNDLLGGVGDTVNDTVGVLGGGSGGGAGGSAGSGAPAPAPLPAPGQATPAPQDATTTPPLQDDGPHGQGAVIETQIENPLAAPIGVTVGKSKGEQDEAGDYHGVITILSVTNLPAVGDVTISESTEEGETVTAPTTAINDALDSVCTAGDVCLGLLDYESETTDDGSQNSFEAVRADVLDGTVSASIISSEGNISEDGECQTAEGSSSATDVGVASDTITVDSLQSDSQSEACQDGTESAEGNSQVLDLGALDALDPLSLLGCDSTAVDDEFAVPLIIEGVCNGDDTNGAQAEAPYNVRVALQLDVLEDVLNAVGVDLDLSAGLSESRAVAPEDETPPPVCPDPDNPACEDPSGSNDPDTRTSQGPGGPGGPGGPSAAPPSGDLPFTGADIGLLALIGGSVAASGLALMALADRRRRKAAA